MSVIRPLMTNLCFGFSHFIDEKIESQDYCTLLTDYRHMNEKSHSIDTHTQREFQTEQEQ